MNAGVRGIQIPMFEEVVREVMGYPVVTRVRPWTRLDVHRHWRRFTVTTDDPDRETPCPVRYDKTHSSEWWDGGTCTACGES